MTVKAYDIYFSFVKAVLLQTKIVGGNKTGLLLSSYEVTFFPTIKYLKTIKLFHTKSPISIVTIKIFASFRDEFMSN